MYRFTPPSEECTDSASIRLAFCASMLAMACSVCAFILIMLIMTCSCRFDWFIATAVDVMVEMSFMGVCPFPSPVPETGHRSNTHNGRLQVHAFVSTKSPLPSSPGIGCFFE